MPQHSFGIKHIFNDTTLYNLKDWLLKTKRFIKVGDLVIPRTYVDSKKVMMTKHKPLHTIKTFKKVFGTCVFNSQSDEWEQIRSKHPFEIFGKDWIYSLKPIVKQIADEFFFTHLKILWIN